MILIILIINRRYRYNLYYEDLDGVHQPTDIGVTTLYVLYDNGYEVKVRGGDFF